MSYNMRAEMALGVAAVLLAASPWDRCAAQGHFQRGDSNADGAFNISDASHSLSFLFIGGAAPPCLDAADANDDGVVDVSDGPFSLNYLFLGGLAPPPPFPSCDADPTGDGLACASFPPCPQGPSFPRPDPDPCDAIEGPCESMLFGPYTLTSVPDGDDVVTLAAHASEEELSIRWIAAGDDAVDVVIGRPAGPSLEPRRIAARFPELGEANVLAAIAFVINTSGHGGAGGAAAAAPMPSTNHAGCDPNELMGIFDCFSCGRCCDFHDVCIHFNCKGPTDAGDLRTCAYWELAYLDCLLDPDRSNCVETIPRCSEECRECHWDVIGCMSPCASPTSFGPGESACCDRDDCGKQQQCIRADLVVETDPASCRPASGHSWGDPHLVTFDRLAYDFQGAGEFVMTRSRDGGLEVQSRTAPWRRSRYVSVMTALAMRVGTDRVAVYLGRSPALHVNGLPLDAGAQPVELAGGGTVARSGAAISILWPDSTRALISVRTDYLNLELQLPGARGGDVEGLLGDFDGDRSNDLRARDGTVLGGRPTLHELYQVYGESWRVVQEESLFDYFDGDGTETYADRSFPDGLASTSSLAEGARRMAEAACVAAGISDPVLLEACILDVGLTGETSFADASRDVPAPAGALEPPGCDRHQVSWTDWTSGNASQAEGTLDGVEVTLTGVILNPQVAGGANYWAAFASTYTSPGLVDTAPETSDIITMVGGAAAGVQTLAFSSPVLDPVMAVISLGRGSVPITYDFDTPFDLLNFGPGHFGNGRLTVLEGDVLSGNEGNGLIRFRGLVQSISWTIPRAENWHGFQIGRVVCR